MMYATRSDAVSFAVGVRTDGCVEFAIYVDGQLLNVSLVAPGTARFLSGELLRAAIVCETIAPKVEKKGEPK